MKAVTVHRGELRVEEVPTPAPGRRQLLVRVLRCGICGSDLHARVHCDATAAATAEVGYPGFMRSEDTVVMGHEFVGEVVSYGPDCRARWAPGTVVVSMPMLLADGSAQLTGLSPHAPGGYAEYVVVQEELTMAVPDGLDPDLAALTEPLAVAHHAVRRGEVARKDLCYVLGCGPIGLAVVLMLKAAGVRTVVASDPSAARRELARRCGADVVVDPTDTSPWTAVTDSRYFDEMAAYFGFAIGAMRKLRTVDRLPWARLMRLAERVGAAPRGPVVFECVGRPGMIEQVVTDAPLLSRVVVVGVCMEPDTFRPTIANAKELELRFAFGYSPAEFHETLSLLGKGKVDPRPLITGTVGLDGVAEAFEQLGTAEHHAKILLAP